MLCLGFLVAFVACFLQMGRSVTSHFVWELPAQNCSVCWGLFVLYFVSKKHGEI